MLEYINSFRKPTFSVFRDLKATFGSADRTAGEEVRCLLESLYSYKQIRAYASDDLTREFSTEVVFIRVDARHHVE